MTVSRLVDEAATRRKDPAYGWANQNRKKPPCRGWDGRRSKAQSNEKVDSVECTFTPPSSSFTPPKEWTG